MKLQWSGASLCIVQVMSLIGIICAATFPHQGYKGFAWTTFVVITGFILSTISFVVHILNFFPDLTLAYITVRLMSMSVLQTVCFICYNKLEYV